MQLISYLVNTDLQSNHLGLPPLKNLAQQVIFSALLLTRGPTLSRNVLFTPDICIKTLAVIFYVTYHGWL